MTFAATDLGTLILLLGSHDLKSQHLEDKVFLMGSGMIQMHQGGTNDTEGSAGSKHQRSKEEGTYSIVDIMHTRTVGRKSTNHMIASCLLEDA